MPKLTGDTAVQLNYLPTIHAWLALDRNEGSKAIEAVESAAPYELGRAGYRPLLPAPVYARGKAFLAGPQGSEAAAEFQKILSRPTFRA